MKALKSCSCPPASEKACWLDWGVLSFSESEEFFDLLLEEDSVVLLFVDLLEQVCAEQKPEEP